LTEEEKTKELLRDMEFHSQHWQFHGLYQCEQSWTSHKISF